MKSFFERISAWLLILFLVGCLIFVFLLFDAVEYWDGIVKLLVNVISTIFLLLLFIFLWLWLVYQSRQEKFKLLKIFSGIVALFLIVVAVRTLSKKSVTEQKSRTVIDFRAELPKDTVRLGEVIYHPSEKGQPYSSAYFSLEVENLSKKYRIENIIINVTAYKDRVAFYKGKAELNYGGILGTALNPKGKTTLHCSIVKVDPDTFPPKPWTFTASVESIEGKPF
jgi:hypothetical protein